MPSRKTNWWKNGNKKENISPYLPHNIVSSSKIAGKTEPFFSKNKLKMKLQSNI